MKHLWLIFSLLSALTASLVPIFGKIGLQTVDANTATAVRAVIMAAFLVLLILLRGGTAGQVVPIIADYKIMLYITLSGVAGALSWLFYFLALKYGKVSQVAPIDKLSVALATIIAVLFFGEKLSPVSGTGIALILAGAVLVAWG
ncbi:MAG TPA: EamA family transporter [Negativicutes bacterium]|nr:EamA family transporter [Negativicutes bacterium]